MSRSQPGASAVSPEARACRTSRAFRTSRALRTSRAVACSVGLALLATAGAAVAQEMPSRKPGLWEITMQITNTPSQNVKHCIDEKTDRQMQSIGQSLDKNACSKNIWRKDGARYIGESECKIGASVATTRSVFAGDFDKAYRGEVDSRFEPPMAGVSQNKVLVTARWAGACPAGWKPGDMQMPGMGRMNVNELMSARSQPPSK
jgi:hypothetical protein